MDYQKIAELLSGLRSSEQNLISIWMPPNDNYRRIYTMLIEELAKARIGQLSDLQIRSLELAINIVRNEEYGPPDNGMMIFAGFTNNWETIALTYSGPFNNLPEGRLDSSLYLMNNQFHLLPT